jgi:magnesium transporter
VEMIELYRDLVLGSRDIYLSAIGNNTNQVMKTLTIISVIGLPFTIVTGFFGMNFFDSEGMHNNGLFVMAIAVMVAAVASLLVWFRMRKWI